MAFAVVRLVAGGALAVVLVAACSADEGPAGVEAPLGTTRAALSFAEVEPITTVHVRNAGALDVEDEYLPQVVCCEHGGAHPEALKAQAVMARTYMAFRRFGEGLGTADKPLSGTTADQAYYCALKVSQACKDAVAATRGQVTAYANASGALFANVSFFVDGPRPACLAGRDCACPKPAATTPMTPQDHPAGCDCFAFASQGAANPAFVTYNWSRSGEDVLGSTIGNPSHESNRGCASQNIQNCLAYAGWAYPDLLRMFYGQDIQLRRLDGTLVGAGDPEPAPAPGAPDGGASEPASGDDRAGDARRVSLGDTGGCSAARAPAGGAGGALWVGAAAAAAALRRRRR